MLSTLFLFGCNAEPTSKPALIDNTLLSGGQIELLSDEKLLEEIRRRDDLEIVENVAECEEDEVYCFRYDGNLIVKMEMDPTQKEFYDLMVNYQLPAGGVIEEAGSEYERVVYENGYKFYTRYKMLSEAPNHSTEEIKPTEEQYFGIVIMWVELAGASRFYEPTDYKQEAHSSLEILNSTKEFVKDEIVLTWIEDCSIILQKFVDAENPDEDMYLKAMEKLNYLGNVAQVYRYENENL